MATTQDLALLSLDVYSDTSTNSNGWTRLQSVNINNFFAAVYQNGNGELSVIVLQEEMQPGMCS